MSHLRLKKPTLKFPNNWTNIQLCKRWQTCDFGAYFTISAQQMGKNWLFWALLGIFGRNMHQNHMFLNNFPYCPIFTFCMDIDIILAILTCLVSILTYLLSLTTLLFEHKYPCKRWQNTNDLRKQHLHWRRKKEANQITMIFDCKRLRTSWLWENKTCTENQKKEANTRNS